MATTAKDGKDRKVPEPEPTPLNWSCGRCAFFNLPAVYRCEVCNSLRKRQRQCIASGDAIQARVKCKEEEEEEHDIGKELKMPKKKKVKSGKSVKDNKQLKDSIPAPKIPLCIYEPVNIGSSLAAINATFTHLDRSKKVEIMVTVNSDTYAFTEDTHAFAGQVNRLLNY